MMGNFSDKLRAYRDRLGMKQRSLAARVGLTPGHLNKIEKGTRKPPEVETVLAMVDVLRLKRDEAEELVQLAGYSPMVLQVGGGLVYDAPPLDASPLPDTFERFFTALGKLATLPRQRHEQCIQRMIELIESEVAESENGEEGN
jgi:transcriptional regulator with XRE-family HTH domain